MSEIKKKNLIFNNLLFEILRSTSSLSFNPNTTIINLNNNTLVIDNPSTHQRCDSHMSNFSSNMSLNAEPNLRSYLPDKLQIVKPIEGSQTLQHWQQLATPNLGCLIEPRPGIYIKGKDPNIDSNSSSCSSTSSSVENDHNIDITVLRQINQQKNKDEFTSDLDDTINLSSIEDNDEYQFINTSSIYTYTDTKKFYGNTKSVFAMPTLMSSDSIDNVNISSNERLILKQLLNSQKEEHVQRNSTTSTTTTLTNTMSTMASSTMVTTMTPATTKIIDTSNSYLDEINILSQKYFTAPLRSDNLKITNKYQIKNIDISNRLNELNLLSNFQKETKNSPDTPPPSPTLACDDDLSDREIENINETNRKDETCKYISTPPTSPINIRENKIKLLEVDFVNEIIDKLSLFSFKSIEPKNIKDVTIPVPFKTQNINNKEFSEILKPLAIYANNNDTIITPVSTPTTNTLPPDLFTPIIEQKEIIPDTPPPSPYRTSPTPSISINDDMLLDLDEKKIQNSAFIKVSTMNPLINKTIDLSKLLGSLTSLKRNQRFV